MSRAEFEELIRDLTKPVNGQYPRPWMTKLKDPLNANVFIVGKNQRNGYLVDKVRSHERHVNAHFNRGGEGCRRLYDEMTEGKPSPTRRNTDLLARQLEDRGICNILETNVICYSSAMSSDLSRVRHKGGRERGSTIFKVLMKWIQPRVLIAHGKGTRDKLQSVLQELEMSIGVGELPMPSETPDYVSFVKAAGEEYSCWITVIDSLAPPRFNSWSSWASSYMIKIADEVGEKLNLD